MRKKIITLIILGSLSWSTLFAQQIWKLDDCMRYAVENSSLSKKQALTEDNAKKTLTERTLGFLPSISASTSVNANFGRSIDPETNAYASMSNFGQNYGASGYIDIFNGLQVVNGYKIAKYSKLREQMSTDQIDNQIASSTMSAYYRAIFAFGTLEIARQELLEYKKNYQKKEIEYEVGLANISDLAQLESSVSQGEYNVISLDGLYQKSLLELKNQMFYPLDEKLAIDTISNSVINVNNSNENVGEIVALAIRLLPDYKIAKQNERISQLELSTEKALLFPKISASGGISTGYSKILEGSEAKQASYSDQMKNKLGEYVGISVSVPIFNGLTQQKRIQRAKNDYKKAQIESEEKYKEIQRLVIESVIDLESFEKQCNQSISNIKSNTLSFKTVEAKFNEGLVSVVDLQATQTNLSRAKIDQLKAFLNYLMQRRLVDYYKGQPLIR